MSSTKIRIAGILSVILMTSCWYYLTNGVWGDYQDLTNQADEVQLSLLTLLILFSGLAGVMLINVSCIIAIYTGKQARTVIGDFHMARMEKVAIYGILLGALFAVVFALYSMKLLDEYGYEYSY
ncbi:hypothetical protein, partial [Aliivibrio fischeri]|uniref:hypothetical protein n=1 Tax=Aliivibrio fischeri TaxID=668 RepID=UPI001F389F55